MTDEKKPDTKNETVIQDADSSENSSTTAQNTLETDVEKAHSSAKNHFEHRNTSISPSREELRANADRAAEIAKNLHETIATSTPEGSTFEVMSNDKNKAAQTQDDITNGADPLAAYEGYSAYAVSQPKSDVNEPQTHDVYSVSEDKKEYKVNYNLVEVNPGSVAKTANNPNAVTGTGISEKSFSYNEEKSGNNTIVTTEYTLHGTTAPSSYHINSGQSEVYNYTNKTTGRYVYDKNDRLTEETHHSTSNNAISDQKSVAYKKQDMSRGETKGDCHTTTEIRASRNSPTTFAHIEYTKDGTEKERLSGNSSPNSESYISQEGNKVIEISHRKNTKGELVYEGHIAQVDGDKTANKETLSPQKAERLFNRYQKDANKHIKDLTGVNGMAEYTQQLGEKKKPLNLNALFDGHAPKPEDKDITEQKNAEVSQKYTNMPTTLVALRAKERG